jgi:phosphatidate cytidylyltransferase
LPTPELPGPVLPGVERLTEPIRTAGEQTDRPGAESAATPLGRSHGRTATPLEPEPEPATATGTIYLPTTSAAGAAPETDLRVVPAVPPSAASAIDASSTSAPTGVPRTAATSPAAARRRRLSATPTRFPPLGPSGEVVDADPLAAGDAPGTRPSRPAAAPAEPASAAATITGAGRARRLPPGGTPASGLTGLPSVSGPAPGPLGSGGLSLPRGPAGLPAAAGLPGSVGGRLVGAGGGLFGAPVAGMAMAGAAGGAAAAGTAGPAVTGALDVVAGLGRAGRRGSGRPDAGRPRGSSPPRTPPRAVGNDADDDQATRKIASVPSGAVVASGAGETPSTRRSARNAETALSRAVPGDETTISPVVPADETAAAHAVRPVAAGAENPGGPADGGTDRRRDRPTRRSVRTGQTGETAVTLAAVAAVPTSRAGRNLPAAIAVGVGLAAAVVASLVVRKEAFVPVVAAAILVALWELTGALRSKRIEVPIVPLGVGALGMLVSAFVAGEDGLLVSFALTAFGVLLWRIIDGDDGATRDVAAAVFVAAYVPFLAGFAMLMLAMPDGALRVLAFVAVTVSNDVGGYVTGVLAGRHPMAPTISPKKSWEGMAGSAALCMIVGAVTVHYLLHGSLIAGVAVGAAAAVTATIGDLSESLIKRDLGIKDMGNLLPGHGGIMDRLDSLLPTAPAVYLLLLLLVPVS